MELDPFKDALGSQLAALRDTTQAVQQQSPDFSGYLRSLAAPQAQGTAPALQSLYQVGYGGNPAAGGFGGGAWDTLAQAASAFGNTSFDAGGAFQALGSFGTYLGVKRAQDAADAALAAKQPKPGAAPSAAPSGGVGTPGADFGAPTADVLNGELRGTALDGQGQTILDAAARRGVPATALMAIFRQESSYRTPSGTNNYGGLRPADGSGGFASYADLATGIDAVAANLGSDRYRGKTLAQVIGIWAPAGDGNDPYAYTNNALTTIHRLGGHATAESVVSGAAPQPGPAPGVQRVGVTPSGYAFPVIGYTGQIADHWGTERGGSDIMAPVGTPVVAMRGGRVIDASFNSLGGNSILVQGDDGNLYYYAHLRDTPMVQAGQTIGSGTPLGFVGTTGNAAGTAPHLHLGIGKTIISGGGATGGLGSDLDAVALLQSVLAGR